MEIIKMKPGKYYIIHLPLVLALDSAELFDKTFENDHLRFLVGDDDNYMEFDDRESWELYYELNK